MLLAKLESSHRYENMHPLFPEAFKFIRENKGNDLPTGRIPLQSERLIAVVESRSGKKPGEALLEAHRNYIDIQYTISGQEEIGWKYTNDCTQIEQPYDPEKDVEFYADQPSLWLPMQTDMFVVFFPEDAHAPFVAESHIRKFIIKIAIE
jgi:YhcH/YjgK/YiaL family protein